MYDAGDYIQVGESLSSRRAWIEIVAQMVENGATVKSLSSRRAWIEIGTTDIDMPASCRSPHGERGLKYIVISYGLFHVKSLSSRRAWIEMLSELFDTIMSRSRSPHGERGLKSL